MIDNIKIIKNRRIKLVGNGIRAGRKVIFKDILYILYINLIFRFIVGFIYYDQGSLRTLVDLAGLVN